MYVKFLVVIIVISLNVVLVVIFLDFEVDFDVNAPLIFPDLPNNFCDLEDPFFLSMITMTVLTTTL